jgi:hypothetical protein
MIEQICGRACKAHPHPFREMESFGQPSRDRSGARPLQDSHTAISRWPFRNRIERSDVEHVSGCGIRDVAIADAIRALQAAAKGKVEIAGIEARTYGRRQIWSGLAKTVLTDHPPSARSEIRFMCERNLRFCPTETSYTAECKKPWRRVPAMLPRLAGRSKRLATEVPSSGAGSEGKIQDYS